MLDDTGKSDVKSLADQLVRWRFLLATMGLVVLAACFPISRQLSFDRRIESLFAPDDPDILAYRELKRAFGGNAVVLLVYQDTELASSAGIARNRDVTKRVQQVPGVTDVLSTARLSDAIQKFRPSLTVDSTPNLFRAEDPVAEGFDEIFSGYTHSRHHDRASVVALLAQDHTPDTITSLQQIAESIPDCFDLPVGQDIVAGQAVIVGEPVLIHDGLSLIERDGSRLAITTVVLLSLVVVVSLVDLRFVLLTAVTIVWSVVVTRAAMVALEIQLSLVSSVLTAIVTVIAVTAVLHLGVRYRGLIARGKPKQEAVTRSISWLLPPIFWTCATDAAGFAALSVSRIAPIRQFGWMIAISATCVFAAILLFAALSMMLPGLGLTGSRQSISTRFNRLLRHFCTGVASYATHHRVMVAACGVIAGAVATVGLGQIETDTSFLNNFRRSSPIAGAYREVEYHFGGAGVWDIVLDAPIVITTEYLDQVRDLERELREIRIDEAKLSKVLSIADAEAVISKSKFVELLPATSRLSAMQLALPGFFNALLSSPENGTRKVRIMLRSQEQLGSQQKEALISEVQQVVQERTSSPEWRTTTGSTNEGRVTGYHILMARLISQLIGDQWRCFAASAFLVWLLLAIATRSAKLATVALLPNLLPVVLVLAVVGQLGGKINMGAAMIAAVSIGISIDSSVHLLLCYQRNRKRGHHVAQATISAAGGIGVPVLLATLALIIGFGVLATSEFVPTATFGLLIAFTLALGTLVNLTLLPALITLVESKSTRGVGLTQKSG